MLLTDVMNVLDELAPLRYAESWDNVGLLVGDPQVEIAKVLVTVDYTAAVADEAVKSGASLVVAYHPAMFAAVKRVPHDALWADAIRRGIALYSPHTALDVALGGTNDFLAASCGMASRAPLRPYTGKPGRSEPEGIGLGWIGLVSRSRGELIEHLKSELGLSYVLVAGPTSGACGMVAVAPRGRDRRGGGRLRAGGGPPP